jgi:hypothetical protein
LPTRIAGSRMMRGSWGFIAGKPRNTIRYLNG